MDSGNGKRAVQKNRAIADAATELFLRHGYQGTSMDQVASLAAVSKQTVYKHFADKEGLFREIVFGITGAIDRFITDVTDTLGNTVDLDDDLRGLARRYVTTVMRPEVLQLRRLMIGEANRFPELGRDYYERGPERVIAAFTSSFEELARRGMLCIEDPSLAARHFAFLVLSIPMDKALVCGDEERLSQADLHAVADAGVRVFLAAYGPKPGRRP